MVRWNRIWGMGLVGCAAWAPLAAQSLWLPASDPVGIGRSGAGIAFGQSLEAASLNPALLVTIKDHASAYLGLGMEMASSQITLQSNQRHLYSNDRNRVLPSFGASWRLNERFALGLKVDSPFMRHAELSPESSVRFMGSRLDLSTHRLEVQAGWALRPDVSLGLGLGMTRIHFASGSHFRSVIPTDPTQAVSSTNPSLALVETEGYQEGNVNALSWSLGGRWAINPRWTLAIAYQSAIKGTPSLSTRAGDYSSTYVANDGFGPAPLGIETLGSVVLNQIHYRPGSGDVNLPDKASIGVRHRLNPFFTWEFDLRFVGSSRLSLPGPAVLTTTANGDVNGPALPTGYRSGYGASVMGELNVLKGWTFRLGASIDPAFQVDQAVNPLLSGARNAAFSMGATYEIWGGEASFGYQFRQNRDIDSSTMEGVWNRFGYHPTGTTSRVEGMGHLWAFGFKRRF